MTHGKTYNKSPRRINHKATKSKTNTGTTGLERSVEQTTGGFKALLQRGNRNTKRTEKHKNKMTHGKTYNKSPSGTVGQTIKETVLQVSVELRA